VLRRNDGLILGSPRLGRHPARRDWDNRPAWRAPGGCGQLCGIALSALPIQGARRLGNATPCNPGAHSADDHRL